MLTAHGPSRPLQALVTRELPSLPHKREQATMSTSPGELQSRTSAEFVESSVLESIVPSRPDIDIEEELRSWNGAIEDETGSILPFLSQRTVLLLGKTCLNLYSDK